MIKIGIIDYYNDTVEQWTEQWYKDSTMLPFLKECKKILNDKIDVLDLGCNSGYETRRMKNIGLNPTGLDLSEKCIAIAKNKNRDIKFVHDNMLNDLSYLGKFDAVISIASIIHIKEDKLELCFKRIYDILNDSGYLFMVVRAEEGKLDSSYKTFNNHEYDREIYGYNKELLERKMNNRFIFIKEMKAHDNHWKYYFYQKSTIN